MLRPMVQPAAIQHMSAAEYLAWERGQLEKHEFHRGEVFAMAGGSVRHNFLANAIGAELRAAFRGKKCHVLSPDQKVAIVPGERFVYPDAVVVCDGAETDSLAKDVLANPRILVEVLSPTTESYDRGEKWEAYQRLPSVKDYLLISQASVRVEHYQREADGSWKYRLLEAGGTVTLTNGATIAVDAVYDGAFELPAA